MKKGKDIFLKSVTLCLLLAFCISALSQATGAEAAAKPKKPSFTVTKRTKTTATIKIKKQDKVTGYHVYVKKGKTGKYRLWTFSFTRTFQIKKLKANSVYYVKIRAYRTNRLSIQKGSFSAVKKIAKYTKPVPKPSPTPTPTPSEENYAQDVLALVNEERAKEGITPLVLDDSLNEAAMVRANELVQSFSHDRPDGSACFTVLNEKGITYHAAGENIAMGQSTPAMVMDSWMNSEGHRNNILSANFGKLGVGFVKSESGQYYWVQLFTD